MSIAQPITATLPGEQTSRTLNRVFIDGVVAEVTASKQATDTKISVNTLGSLSVLLNNTTSYIKVHIIKQNGSLEIAFAIFAEIETVGSSSTSFLHLLRGRESTQAVALVEKDQIYPCITSTDLNQLNTQLTDFEARITALENT